jgi:hypothetical protein
MNKETFGIGILSLTAVVLFVANFFATPPAALGLTSIKDRDYQLATAPTQAGGEALYILDNRTGNLSIFTYDVVAKRMALRATRPIAEVFTPRR